MTKFPDLYTKRNGIKRYFHFVTQKQIQTKIQQYLKFARSATESKLNVLWKHGMCADNQILMYQPRYHPDMHMLYCTPVNQGISNNKDPIESRLSVVNMRTGYTRRVLNWSATPKRKRECKETQAYVKNLNGTLMEILFDPKLAGCLADKSDVVANLHTKKQCLQCGLRPTVIADHLDKHFRYNTKFKQKNKTRGWFKRVNKWTKDEKSGPPPPSAPETNTPPISVRAENAGVKCACCHTHLRETWNDHTGFWKYEDAILCQKPKFKNSIICVDCYNCL